MNKLVKDELKAIVRNTAYRAGDSKIKVYMIPQIMEPKQNGLGYDDVHYITLSQINKAYEKGGRLGSTLKSMMEVEIGKLNPKYTYEIVEIPTILYERQSGVGYGGIENTPLDLINKIVEKYNN